MAVAVAGVGWHEEQEASAERCSLGNQINLPTGNWLFFPMSYFQPLIKLRLF